MSETTFRDMEESDVRKVSELAEQIWRSHYPGIISDGQIDYMLRQLYAPESLKQQLKNGEKRFRLAEVDADPVAFIVVTLPEEDMLFINSFYVEDSYRNKGVGSRLLQDTIARYPEIRRVRLHVNRNNENSIAYYQRRGFANIGERDSDIGGGFIMQDFIMQRELPA